MKKEKGKKKKAPKTSQEKKEKKRRRMSSCKKKHAVREPEFFGNAKQFVVKGVEFPPKEWNIDWTKHEDPLVWQVYSNRRFDMMREVLSEGRHAQMYFGGTSLEPIVLKGEVLVFAPVDTGTVINPGDIVFCHTYPGWRYHCLKVWHKKKDDLHMECFVVGNNKQGAEARSHGWCYRYQIYGLLVSTDRFTCKRTTLSTA